MRTLEYKSALPLAKHPTLSPVARPSPKVRAKEEVGKGGGEVERKMGGVRDRKRERERKTERERERVCVYMCRCE